MQPASVVIFFDELLHVSLIFTVSAHLLLAAMALIATGAPMLGSQSAELRSDIVVA
jgi:hypothetical protein